MLSRVGAPLRQYIAGGEYIANRDMPEIGVKLGERVPWRSLGIHEVCMHELWRANIVDCEPQAPVSANEASKLATLTVTPGPVIRVETPSEKRNRHHRR